jgi:heme-degrading monooxygenase HmoA
MFTRLVEIKTKRGKAKAVCHTIHTKILSVLGRQPGFIDEIVLISDTVADRVVAMSFWKTKQDAMRYAQKRYAKIRKMIRHQIHAAPRVRTFAVETSTVHKIARGIKR